MSGGKAGQTPGVPPSHMEQRQIVASDNINTLSKCEETFTSPGSDSITGVK